MALKRPSVPLTVQSGARIGVTLFLAVICFMKQRFDGISVIIAIPIGLAVITTVVAQLQINLTVQLLIDVIYCDKQVTNNVCNLVFVFFFNW